MNLKTNGDTLIWIYNNLGDTIREVTNVRFKDTRYTESWLAGQTCKEVGFLINRYANRAFSFKQISLNMKGDYGKRPGEAIARYHGFGYPQIDIGSYPDFINQTPLDNVIEWYIKMVRVLEEKRMYLESKGYTESKLGTDKFDRAIMASYNCGAGNVVKALNHESDVDYYTFQRVYSQDARKFRHVYYDLFTPKSEGTQDNNLLDMDRVERAKASAPQENGRPEDFSTEEAKPGIIEQ